MAWSAKAKETAPWITRYIFVGLSFISFICNYMMRLNVSLAIVAMVNHTAVNENDEDSGSDSECGKQNEQTEDDAAEDGPFVWDESDQAIILGSLWYGYCCSQIVAGRAAERFGAKQILGTCLGLCALLSLLTPLMAKVSFVALVIIRIVMGVLEGVSYPVMNVMIAKWAPKEERSRISAFVYAGSNTGTALTFSLGGFLIDAFGWESLFYFSGAVTLIWWILWILLVYDSPTQHPRISPEELHYILSSQEHTTSSKRISQTPWKSIVTSRPYLAAVFACFGNSIGLNLLLSKLPTYMALVLGFNIVSNGLLSALPYVLYIGYGFIHAYVSDWMIEKRILTTTQARKISNSIAEVSAALCFIGVALVGCNTSASVAFFAIAGLLEGADLSGFLPNSVDLAPNYAGTLMGIGNTLASFTAWIVPFVVGLIVDGKNTLERWRKVFYLTAGFLLVSSLIYVVFGSGEEQPWNRTYTETELTPPSRTEKINDEETPHEPSDLQKRRRRY
ncbi:unnamed protein product [Cyprideis torosa]|uniref:Uncharacterized protein n=1 Tax=Cyprideis torosa TaxID=163714 RepID=A0A7R8ZLL4_9CRUS|nr:unnamed protein product [Cyprideis torosa]CAG0886950.1 unnamed protein product [Cyprideis torosa]